MNVELGWSEARGGQMMLHATVAGVMTAFDNIIGHASKHEHSAI